MGSTIGRRAATRITVAALAVATIGFLPPAVVVAAVDPTLLSTPPTLDFGTVAPGVPTAPLTTTITNTLGTPATLGAVAITGPDPQAFEIASDTCSSATLAPAGTCATAIRFMPAATTSYAAALEVPVVGAPDGTAPLSIGLSGAADYSQTYPTIGALHGVGATGTWSGGNALATTRSTSTTYLHAVATSLKAGTSTVKDGGPYSPIVYLRSSNLGTTWTSGTRLNSTSQHGVWPGIASSSAYVYASWVKVSRVRSWSTTAARYIQFRRNSNHGSASWTTTKNLTSTSGRVDFPTIAAAGSNVYIAYTDANNGSVRLLVSRDRGSAWAATSIGTTTLTSTSGGRTGVPSVAASGSLVIVAWVSSSAGTVKARISLNGGSTFGSTVTLASSNRSYPSAAAAPGRAGVGFIGTEPSFRVWMPGGWGPTRTVPGVNHDWLVELYGPALVLIGSNSVGIAFSGCIQLCDIYRDGSHAETQYAESPDSGVSWYVGYPLPVGAGYDGRPIFDGVSVVATSTTRRDFTFTGSTPATGYTRVYGRSWTFPIGTASVARAKSSTGGVAGTPVSPHFERDPGPR